MHWKRLNLEHLFLWCLKMEVPRDIFLKILSYHDPFYREAFTKRTPSARCFGDCVVVSPLTEYMMIRGRIVALHWDRPYAVVVARAYQSATRASI